MPELGQIARKVRSKNAGPFWLTIDIFCGDEATYARVRDGLSSVAVAQALGVRGQDLKRFDMAELYVVKFSLPRPVVQGHIHDADMHGAAWGALIAELEIA